MTLHCDHCRGKLGGLAHRYWQMRFCSTACTAAYQARLADGTRAKIKRLETATPRQPGSAVRASGMATAAAA